LGDDGGRDVVQDGYLAGVVDDLFAPLGVVLERSGCVGFQEGVQFLALEGHSGEERGAEALLPEGQWWDVLHGEAYCGEWELLGDSDCRVVGSWWRGEPPLPRRASYHEYSSRWRRRRMNAPIHALHGTWPTHRRHPGRRHGEFEVATSRKGVRQGQGASIGRWYGLLGTCRRPSKGSRCSGVQSMLAYASSQLKMVVGVGDTWIVVVWRWPIRVELGIQAVVE
jgi:hypothetical protein